MGKVLAKEPDGQSSFLIMVRGFILIIVVKTLRQFVNEGIRRGKEMKIELKPKRLLPKFWKLPEVRLPRVELRLSWERG